MPYVSRCAGPTGTEGPNSSQAEAGDSALHLREPRCERLSSQWILPRVKQLPAFDEPGVGVCRDKYRIYAVLNLLLNIPKPESPERCHSPPQT